MMDENEQFENERRTVEVKDDEAFWITLCSDPDFDAACLAIDAAYREAFDREDAIEVLEAKGIAPVLRKALAEMTFEEWEDFVVNHLD